MSENQKEGSEIGLLYGSILDRLLEIKESGKFAPIEKDEEFGPEWDYVGTMAPDAKALWTMLGEIRAFGKSLCKKIGTGDDDKALVSQNEILVERHKIIKMLLDNCIKTQVFKDLAAAGIDLSRLEIAFAAEYKIFVRIIEDEECTNCPICQMGQSGPGILVDMQILSPTGLSPEIVKGLMLSAIVGGFGKKKKSEKDEGCDHASAEDLTDQDINN